MGKIESSQKKEVNFLKQLALPESTTFYISIYIYLTSLHGKENQAIHL